MKIIFAILTALFIASAANAQTYWPPICYSSCAGFCNGYFYNGGIAELNYYNPLCANVCCPSSGGAGLATGGLSSF